MKIIGICGRSGSGKSTVGKIIKNIYPAYIDCDMVSRDVTKKGSKCLSELVDFFGEEILLDDGSLNRSKLASIAFSDAEKLNFLNKITHKHIIEAVENLFSFYSSKGERFVFVDAPTLFESELNKKCDFVVTVFSSEENMISRIKARDNKTNEEVQKRLSSQLNYDFLKANSQYIIVNDGTLMELEKKTMDFLKEIEKL
jgi:dephospho-CoA kinase